MGSLRVDTLQADARDNLASGRHSWLAKNSKHISECPPTLRGINDKLKQASAAKAKSKEKVDAAHQHYTALSLTAHGRGGSGSEASMSVVLRDTVTAAVQHGPMLRQASFALEFLQAQEDDVLKRLVDDGTAAKERMANAAIAQRSHAIEKAVRVATAELQSSGDVFNEVVDTVGESAAGQEDQVGLLDGLDGLDGLDVQLDQLDLEFEDAFKCFWDLRRTAVRMYHRRAVVC